jgi:catechol 2,3-dioxygenase-like lactoylglutathione lyase family enzyme
MSMNEGHLVTGINHITLAVSDLNRSFHFYANVVGLKPVAKWERGAYFLAGKGNPYNAVRISGAVCLRNRRLGMLGLRLWARRQKRTACRLS